MSNELKVFLAVHVEKYVHQDWKPDTSFCVISANTEGEALGIALEYSLTSKATEWQIKEISTEQALVGVQIDNYDFEGC